MAVLAFVVLLISVQHPYPTQGRHFFLHAPPTSPTTPFIETQVTTEDSSSPWGVTVCSFVRLRYYRQPLSQLIQLLNRTGASDPLHLSLGVLPTGDVVIKDGGSVYTNAVSGCRIPLMTWTHVCLVVAKEFTHVFVGGLLVKGINVTRSELESFAVSIGGEKDWDDEKKDGKGNFAGDISYPEVWLEVLPYRDVLKTLSECRPLNIPPKTVTWEYSGDVSVILHKTREEPCRESAVELTLVPLKLKFSEAKSFCSNLNLDLIDTSTVQKKDIAKEFLLTYKGFCFELGKGAWVEQSVPHKTPGSICKASSSTAKHQNIPCSSELCAICRVRKNRQLMYMRGISPEDPFELTFIVANDANSSTYFQEDGGQTIEWTKDKWLLKTGMYGSVVAELHGKDIIGSKVWTVREAWGDKSAGTQALVAFNSCSRDQSWCSSGICIAATQRCNRIRDCDDGSDEEECFSKAPQIATSSFQPLHGGNVDVALEVTVLRLVQDTEGSPLQAVIKYTLTWTDVTTEFPNITRGKTTRLPDSFPVPRPSIAPEGLRPSPDLCIGEECESPALVTVYIQPSSVFATEPSDDKTPTTATLRLSILSVHALDCQGQYMTFFPFEEHICELHLRPTPESYVVTSLSAVPPVRYTQHFIVESVQLRGLKSRDDATTYAKSVLKIHVKRMCGFYVVLVFIPSFFLLMLNSIVLWVQEPQEYRLTTSLFVALFFLFMWLVIVVNGPKSSSIRAIDVWMSFAVTHSLLHVIVNIIVRALLVNPEDQPRSRSMSTTLSSRPLSRLRQVKPLEVTTLYDAILAKMAKDENENTWTLAYWVMFCARIVSPALSVLFMFSFWPFVVYYAKENM